MARPLRLEFAGGALYHITARGNRRAWIYEMEEDRTTFLSLLSEVCQDFNWVCHAFCLMDNHYHLLSYCLMTNQVHLVVQAGDGLTGIPS